MARITATPKPTKFTSVIHSLISMGPFATCPISVYIPQPSLFPGLGGNERSTSFRTGGRIPAFARCCFCIAANLLVFTSPMRFSLKSKKCINKLCPFAPFCILIKPKQLYVSHSNRCQNSTDFDILVFAIPTTTPDSILTDNFSNLPYVRFIHSSKRKSKDDHLRHLS